MRRSCGCPDSAIWMLGDSPPSKHEHWLDEPLDRRFPTRHNIWTSIESVINRELFVHDKSRIDDRRFFVYNAVASSKTWENESAINTELSEFRKQVGDNRPFLFLAFGRRAFEFARRFQGEEPNTSFSSLSVPKIKEQFDARFPAVRQGEKSLLPLLHASIARQPESCYKAYKTNYFEYVGCELATIFKEHREDDRFSKLWM